jgi:hypothetical protein
MDTYNGGSDAVSVNVNGLDQSGLLEGTDGAAGNGLGTSVEPKGRGGCGEDGEECEGGNLHGFSARIFSLFDAKSCATKRHNL